VVQRRAHLRGCVIAVEKRMCFLIGHPADASSRGRGFGFHCSFGEILCSGDVADVGLTKTKTVASVVLSRCAPKDKRRSSSDEGQNNADPCRSTNSLFRRRGPVPPDRAVASFARGVEIARYVWCVLLAVRQIRPVTRAVRTRISLAPPAR